MSTKLWGSYDADEPEPHDIECKHCGKGGLHWEDTDEGFRLYDARNKKHACPPADVSGDFEVLT